MLESLHLGQLCIWKLSVQNKMKRFAWRLAHNTLAVKTILDRKGMDINPKCFLCNRDFEDFGHLFFQVQIKKDVDWKNKV